jgi:hypothetical protein
LEKQEQLGQLDKQDQLVKPGKQEQQVQQDQLDHLNGKHRALQDQLVLVTQELDILVMLWYMERCTFKVELIQLI